MPKAFSAREKEIIQVRLLEEAFRLFTTHGFSKTSVEDITRAASISKGAFYLFYSSKEELFMEVIDQAEGRYRLQVLESIRQQSSELSQRQRLKNVLSIAFSIWKTEPILKFVTMKEYEGLLRKLPPELVHTHLEGDREFVRMLIEQLQQAGIEIKIDEKQLYGLANALFFVSLHEDDFGEDVFSGTIDVLVHLMSAYCLGEVDSF